MITMAASDVPVASRCSYPSQRISRGTMIVPPPMPNRALKAPAAVAIAARRTSREDIAGHTTSGVRSHRRRARGGAAPAPGGALPGRDLLRRGRHARADRGPGRGRPRARGGGGAARAPGAPLRLRGLRLRALRRRGAPPRGGRAGSPTRAPTERSCSSPAPRRPGSCPRSRAGRGACAASRPSATRRSCGCCASGSRTRDPIAAFHWRGVPDEDAALAQLERIATRRRPRGSRIHWGRKVLEVRPPVPIGKGHARPRPGDRRRPANRPLRR